MQKAIAGDFTDMGSLISRKASGDLKAARDGELNEEKQAKLKATFADAKKTADKKVAALHVFLLENGKGKKIQFTVISEGGKRVISKMDIR